MMPNTMHCYNNIIIALIPLISQKKIQILFSLIPKGSFKSNLNNSQNGL